MSEKLTHWKKLTNPDYVGAWDFQPGQELTVKIETVRNEVVKLFDGKTTKEETCILATFEGGKKPMILNRTNCKIIANNLGGDHYIEHWIGKTITLYVAKVRAFGEMTDAVRVKSTK